ncbi:MAG: alpha/beta hydrolase [Chloroflexi bacterium]|nr:alpha/beta hydrolase [Chloroflexota bacterium]
MNTKRKKIVVVTWMVSFVLCLSCCRAGSLPGPTPKPTSPPIPTLSPTLQPPVTTSTGSFSTVKIDSAALAKNLIGEKTERPINVYLPPTYDTSTKRYPVVYFLPGFEDTTMGISLPGSMDALIQAGTIREIIIVVVPGNNKIGGSFYVNSPVTGNWEDFVVQEVVGYIDSHYRTIAQAGSRGISGHSMGGFGALNIAMLHPDVFRAVYGLSPGLFDEKGLANSQMFLSEYYIGLFLDEQKAILAKPQDQQLDSVLTLRDNFTVAYGLAFAPDPQNPPFYFDYPYSKSSGKLVRDDNIWKRWDGGFGGIPQKIAQYKENFLRLKGITVDYGTNDEFAWIPQGCIYFDTQLTAAGVPHEMAVHNGNHQSSLGKRVLEHMLPFFSELLVGE